MIDFDKLSEAQLRVAEKVLKEAERQGIDPDLALAVAYQESRFGANTVNKKSSARGPMQLLEGTAKELGVDANDEDQNIRGGVTYLKQQIEKYEDPLLAAVAYHDGPNSDFFKTGDPDKITPEGLDYAKNIQSYGNFTPTSTDVSRQNQEDIQANEQSIADQARLGQGIATAVGGAGSYFNEKYKGQPEAIREARVQSREANAAAGQANKALRAAEADVNRAVKAEQTASQRLASSAAQVDNLRVNPTAVGGYAGDKWATAIGGPGGRTVTEAAANYRLGRDLPKEGVTKGFGASRSGLLLPNAVIADSTTQRPGAPSTPVQSPLEAAEARNAQLQAERNTAARRVQTAREALPNARFNAEGAQRGAEAARANVNRQVASPFNKKGLGRTAAAVVGTRVIPAAAAALDVNAANDYYNKGDYVGTGLQGTSALLNAAGTIAPVAAPVTGTLSLAIQLMDLARTGFFGSNPVEKKAKDESNK